MDDLMKVDEVAKWLRVKPKTVYEMARTKRIPHSKVAGLRFSRKALEAWLNQNNVRVTA